jgi:hypothetical protein
LPSSTKCTPATTWTEPCNTSNWPPLAKAQTQTVWSDPPVTRQLPSGERNAPESNVGTRKATDRARIHALCPPSPESISLRHIASAPMRRHLNCLISVSALCCAEFAHTSQADPQVLTASSNDKLEAVGSVSIRCFDQTESGHASSLGSRCVAPTSTVTVPIPCSAPLAAGLTLHRGIDTPGHNAFG